MGQIPSENIPGISQNEVFDISQNLLDMLQLNQQNQSKFRMSLRKSNEGTNNNQGNALNNNVNSNIGNIIHEDNGEDDIIEI